MANKQTSAWQDKWSVVRTVIWTGFETPFTINDWLIPLFACDDEEPALKRFAVREFNRKAEAERSWPQETDCDRLDFVFEELSADGIIALHKPGFINGYADCAVDFLREYVGAEKVKGHCYYVGEEVFHALDEGKLYLAFGCGSFNDPRDDDFDGAIALGHQIKTALEAKGFRVEWNGTLDCALVIPEIDWKRRAAPRNRWHEILEQHTPFSVTQSPTGELRIESAMGGLPCPCSDGQIYVKGPDATRLPGHHVDHARYFARLAGVNDEQPVGVVTYYGPQPGRRTKLIATVIPKALEEMRDSMCYTGEHDVSKDERIHEQVRKFFEKEGVVERVVFREAIGCEHQERGVFEPGKPCPFCPAWSLSQDDG